jgi:hypothetical protein
MSTALTLFDAKTVAIPDYLRDLNDEGNIPDKQTTPSLSFEGKVWTISLNGEKVPLMKRDADGDEIPVSVMRAVILGFNPRRGRSYYPGAYDPAKASQPTCWSDDGDKPHPSIAEPQSRTCAECPLAVKGSKVSEQGKAVAACSQHRIMAVVPAHKMDMEPLRMKIPVTSDYDKELDDPQWFAFQQYRDFLKARGVNHSAMVVTKMKFDPSVAYPKVVFSPDRFLTPDEVSFITPVVKSEAVTKLLAGTWTPAGVNGIPIATEADDDGAAIAAAKAKARVDAEAEAALQAEAKRAADAKAAKAAKAKAKAEAEAAAAAAKAEAEAKAKASKPSAAIIMDDDDEVIAPPRAAPARPAAPVAVDPEIPADLKELLSDWDD